MIKGVGDNLMKNTNFLAHFLKKKRVEYGLTQKKLAQALFVSDKTVSKWERGESLPSLAQIGDIIYILEIADSEFMSLIRPPLSAEDGNRLRLNLDLIANEILQKLNKQNTFDYVAIERLAIPAWSQISALHRRQIERYLNYLIETRKIDQIEVKKKSDTPPFLYRRKQVAHV